MSSEKQLILIILVGVVIFIYQYIKDEKKKHDRDIVVGTHTCNDGMSSKKFISLLDELSDVHDADDITITVEVEVKQNQY